MPNNKAASNPPSETPPSNTTAVGRTILPFAPLAIALLVSRAVVPGSSAGPVTGASGNVVAATCEEVLDEQDCHSRYPTGCSTAAGYDPYLNLLKNQLIPPSSASTAAKFLAEADYRTLDQHTPSGLTSKNHGDFGSDLAKLGEGQVFGVVGYLYYAKPTGAESSNCQLTKDDAEGSNVDYHIGLGFDATFGQRVRSTTSDKQLSTDERKQQTQTSVVVEMTPHYRAQFENQKWTLEALQKARGRLVRVAGQLLMDSEHNLASQNCALATTSKERQSCWRASAWELHPVTAFEVCGQDDCSSSSGQWVKLEDWSKSS